MIERKMMMNLNIDELNILNVAYREAIHLMNTFNIVFTIDESSYVLYAEQGLDGLFYPTCIEHLKGKKCPYCETNSRACLGFSGFKKELFHRLIEHPSIRLEWLYIDHI